MFDRGSVDSGGGWNSQPQQQHFSTDQGASGSAQVDGDPQAQVVAAMQQGQGAPSGGQGVAPQGGAPQGGVQPQGQKNPFYEGILAQVDPAHRAIVEPYLGKWDAGVTRRFQELQGQLQPFQQLGADPNTLAEAYQLYQMIDENPQQVLELLQQAVGEGVPQGQQGQQQPQGLEGQPGGAPGSETPAIPPELEQRLGVFEQVLETIAQKFMDQQQEQSTQQADQQLDQYLGLLKTEFGDFDEPYILAQMMAGKSGEEAVKAFQAAVQGQVNQRSRQQPLPKILGGGGAVPQEGKSVADASPKDTRALVANILAASNG